MPDQKVYTDEQVNRLIKAVTDKQIAGFITALNDGKNSHEMSQDTSKRFDKLEKTIETLQKSLCCNAHNNMILEHERAIFGDDKDETEPGMKNQLDYIYKLVIGAKGAGFVFKLVIALVAGLALLGGAILSFKVWILK